MSQFHSKKQRKKVMGLVKDKKKWDKEVLKKLRHGGEITEHEKKMLRKVRNLNEQDHEVYMNKAFFKGRKGETKHIMIPSKKIKGKQYYQVSALSPTKHRKYY